MSAHDSAFMRQDYHLAYLSVFALLGVTNARAAEMLAELTHSLDDVVEASRAMRGAILAGDRSGIVLESTPGAVLRALDVLRPRHEEWVRATAAASLARPV